MSDQRKDQFFFVGRKAELAQFDAFLRDPHGQAAVVVGQQGMGKTMLLDKFEPGSAYQYRARQEADSSRRPTVYEFNSVNACSTPTAFWPSAQGCPGAPGLPWVRAYQYNPTL